jgi:carbamoyl-phosphate synthase large subunit
MNILITSASRQVTLVKEFKKALKKISPGRVIAADIDTNTPAIYFADDSCITPKSSDEQFIPFLINYCKQEKIDLLVSSRDEELVVLAANKSLFEDVGCKVMVADKETINICYDKILFCKFCKDNSIPIPHTYSSSESVEFPAFIKPRFGKGSRNTFKINNLKELNTLVDAFGDQFLVQEFVGWKEYTIDLFADFDGKIISVLPRERIRTFGGESYVTRTFKNDILIDQSIMIAKKLGLVGKNAIQCFFNGTDVKFIEVNARYGGGANLGFRAGHCTPEYLVRLILGETLEPQIGNFDDGVTMLRYTNDIFVDSNREIHHDHEESKIYCIDIDGTLCTEGMPYEEARPLHKTINKVNRLYEQGNRILLFTARGCKSKVDWASLTRMQLASWGVKYHQLIFDKPYADFYIDNKAVDVLDWV